MKSKEKAVVKTDCMTDGSLAYNVSYLDAKGDSILLIGATDQQQAEDLAELLNAVAWVHVG